MLNLMVKKIFILLVSFQFFMICNAQKRPENHEMDSLFYYEPMYLDSNLVAIKSLKLEKGTLQVYQQVFKTTTSLVFDSSFADFKVKQNARINMLVKFNPNSVYENIKSEFKLFLLEVNFNKKYRRIILSNKKQFVNSFEVFNSGIPIQFTKASENSLILNFDNLALGEYLLVIGKSYYTFSVN